MKNRVAITIKLPPDLIEQADAFIATLPYRPTRTAFIEEAIRQALEKAEKKRK
jgi:metal-responsive CopG/Arc/MetJ family transcriptional regulator